MNSGFPGSDGSPGGPGAIGQVGPKGFQGPPGPAGAGFPGLYLCTSKRQIAVMFSCNSTLNITM